MSTTYPFLPKHGNELAPGDWWDIATDRVFGFGICAGPWHRTGVLAAFLSMTKSEPVLNADDPIEIYAMGYLDLKSIAYCGGQVRGRIPFDLEALLQGARVTHRDLKFNEPRMIIRKAITAGKKDRRRKP